jgi:hypothetical protein
VFGKRAFDGIPGMLSALPADVASSAADRSTLRRVSPMRSSFNRWLENVCW